MPWTHKETIPYWRWKVYTLQVCFWGTLTIESLGRAAYWLPTKQGFWQRRCTALRYWWYYWKVHPRHTPVRILEWNAP